MEGMLLIIIFLVLLFFHVPIMIALGVSSVTYCVFISDAPMAIVTNTYFTALDSFTLIAIPFFILAGDLMMTGGISKRLINFCMAVVGTITGAMGCVTVFACMIFAAVAGSGTATVACIGGITIPEMLKQKYDRGFACALASVAGALGPIIPPSVAMIIYGVICGVSVTALFLGGVIPGILIGLCLMVFVHFVAKAKGYGKNYIEDVSKGKVISLRATLKDSIWALMVPVIILGGIYGGIFTPTEAAVVACDYALIIGLFVYKEFRVRDIPAIFKRTVLTGGTIMLLVACATALGRLLTIEMIPTKIANGILSLSDNAVIILLVINLFLLLVGMFMETYAAIIILSPVLLPTVKALGVDPLHFGIIMVINLSIGLCTPPVGVNLFLSSRIGNCPIEGMVKWLLPTIGVVLIVLMAVTYIPALSTWLPGILMD